MASLNPAALSGSVLPWQAPSAVAHSKALARFIRIWPVSDDKKLFRNVALSTFQSGAPFGAAGRKEGTHTLLSTRRLNNPNTFPNKQLTRRNYTAFAKSSTPAFL